MTEVILPDPPTKLLKGYKWPKDIYGDKIEVNDYLMFVTWSRYPRAVLGQVIKVGKTGKVTARTVRIHPKDRVEDVEIKEASQVTRLTKNMISAMTLDKLANIS